MIAVAICREILSVWMHVELLSESIKDGRKRREKEQAEGKSQKETQGKEKKNNRDGQQ